MESLEKWPGLRPNEIKTYHKESYGRISPSETQFEGKGKTVLITGGATGIGFATSRSFAQAATERLVIVGRRPEPLANAKKSLSAEFLALEIETYSASQSDYKQMSEVLDKVGAVDVLVLCAAAFQQTVAIDQLPKEVVEEAFATNVLGPYHIIQEYMKAPSPAGGSKTVIYVSSAASQIPITVTVGYGASKAAMNFLIGAFATGFANQGVRFYSYHPGIIWTPASQDLMAKEMVEEWEDVKLPADFAVWLASPEATFLSGRFLWAQWDVDELIGLKERIENEPRLLTQSVLV